MTDQTTNRVEKKSELWVVLFGMALIALAQVFGRSDPVFIGAITTLCLAYIGGRSTVKAMIASRLGIIDANSNEVRTCSR